MAPIISKPPSEQRSFTLSCTKECAIIGALSGGNYDFKERK